MLTWLFVVYRGFNDVIGDKNSTFDLDISRNKEICGLLGCIWGNFRC